MTELLMITEEVDAHINKNLDTVSQTADNYQMLLSQANALIPADWESPSANEFLDRLNELTNKYNAKLEEMTELVSKLENELAQWFETSETFTYK